MHGKKFFCDGAVELNQWKAEATGREKDKKSRVEYHARCEAALPIIDRLKNELEKQGAGGSARVEGCARVDDGERR